MIRRSPSRASFIFSFYGKIRLIKVKKVVILFETQGDYVIIVRVAVLKLSNTKIKSEYYENKIKQIKVMKCLFQLESKAK